LGKTPVLVVNDTPIFESAVILEYLEDTQANPLHPAEPLSRAHHRSWIEFGSAILNDIAGLYAAPDAAAFALKGTALRSKFERVEAEFGPGPWFGGPAFGLVDAVFGPVFRYFDSFDRVGDFGILTGLPKVTAWRNRMATRPSVTRAVAADYPQRLDRFLLARGSHLSALMRDGSRGAAAEPLTTAASE
jgi:glutathione S-transferase